MFFLIGYFIYLHFKCYPLSQFLHPPSLCFYEGALPLTHSLPPLHPDIPLHWGIKPSQDQGPLLPLMSYKAILCYICGQSHGSLHVYFLVGGLVSKSSWGSTWFILMFFLWVANHCSSFSPFSTSSIGDQCLAMSICLCTCQALEEPLRRQLYQASASKHFLPSTIVSGFGDCIW